MTILIQLHKLFVIFDDNQQLSSNGTTPGVQLLSSNIIDLEETKHDQIRLQFGCFRTDFKC